MIAGVASTATADAVGQAALRQARRRRHPRHPRSYFPLKDAQVESYFRAIADAVDIPVVLYTNPKFQRSDLTLDVIARLAEHPRIPDIKDASTNTGRLLSIMNRCAGHEGILRLAHIPAAVMLIGGVGWMAGPAYRAAPSVRSTISAAPANGRGDGAAAQAVAHQRGVRPLQPRRLHQGRIANQGYAVGDPVPPQPALTAEEREIVEKTLAELEVA